MVIARNLTRLYLLRSIIWKSCHEVFSICKYYGMLASICAERVLADRRDFALDSKTWKAFQIALDHPAVLKPRLQALLGESDPFID